MATSDQLNQRLQAQIVEFMYDPLAYVLFNYPWGDQNTWLADFDGPDIWQAELLTQLGEELQKRVTGEAEGPVQIARASGHGIGKTTLIAWLIDWYMDTRMHPQILCTSNTKQQLETKTWRELAKWNSISLTGFWKEHVATSYYNRMFPRTWRANAIPWSKERSEAFAGTHEQHVMVVYDEASLIDKVIWDVTEGAMTSGECIWIVFGNPTRSSGRFFDVFHKLRHRWLTGRVDSRDAMIPKKLGTAKKFQEWIEDYGEDSDFVKVRVRGIFPDAASLQFIPTRLVMDAMERTHQRTVIKHAPRVLGVDVARFGDDQSVIFRRQGLVAFAPKKFRGIDLMKLSSIVAQEIRDYGADACFVDGTGLGAGVVDRLRQLDFDNIIEVNNGERATDDKKYANVGTENWGRMRDWLKYADIPFDDELLDDITGREYGYDMKERMRLEKKEDMKARGLQSPDNADALALTFHEKVQTMEDRAEQERLEALEEQRKKNKKRVGTGRVQHKWRHVT